ncbi:MAG: 1-deoxy-D-xylulose-5-phosphate reductoisomerase [Treponema sp.]|jgi:1-deoxy-D-xylulose-5-phosphate reductoisomerase|nr:1-deoxy-D-xylulose-5-phosphate reductoisomerase [Treponema sp.]
MRKKVAILGATGSIGKSAVEVLRQGVFETVLLTAHSNADSLVALKEHFPKAKLALSGNGNKGQLIDYYGVQGLHKAIEDCKADIVINGISGAAGLEPSIAAINTGCCLALANKETIVMAGPLIKALLKEKNARLIPVDSEHSAIFQLIQAHGKENIAEIILTASGGPFKNYPETRLAHITPQEALIHPTWLMGHKITIDSATLANKGLEVIEAVRLFDFPPEKIRVLVHPQSIIHSMVRLKDGCFYAQMSKPDMRHPIHNALYWPEVVPSSLEILEFENLSLDFSKPDTVRFPMLSLAYRACKEGQGVYPMLPAVYNAANEVAVHAFLEGQIGFLEIPHIVEYVMNNMTLPEYNAPALSTVLSLSDILDADKKARAMALRY